MPRAAATVMQLCAMLIFVVLGMALHALMPGVSLWKACMDFIGLCVVFAFACTLLVASLLVGSAPGRSKLGQRLAGKVDAQTGEARKAYEQIIRKAGSTKASGAEAAVRKQETRR